MQAADKNAALRDLAEQMKFAIDYTVGDSEWVKRVHKRNKTPIEEMPASIQEENRRHEEHPELFTKKLQDIGYTRENAKENFVLASYGDAIQLHYYEQTIKAVEKAVTLYLEEKIDAKTTCHQLSKRLDAVADLGRIMTNYMFDPHNLRHPDANFGHPHNTTLFTLATAIPQFAAIVRSIQEPDKGSGRS